jgi:hypothetical protein
MAIRKVKLAGRIMSQHANTSQAMTGSHPYGTAATPMEMPSVLVTVSAGPLITADGAPIPAGQAGARQPASGSAGQMPAPPVTLAVSDLDPLITADGAVIAATGPGRWDQLRAAGR